MKPTTDRHGQPQAEMSPRVVDRDIDVRGVTITVLGVAALVVVAALAMWWLLGWFLAGAESADPVPPPAWAATPRELPPGPRLQASPEQEWDRMRAQQEEILSSYGRTGDGAVRIPIERAIEVLAARGRVPAGGAPATGTAGAAAPPAAGEAGAAGAADAHAGHPHRQPGDPVTRTAAEDAGAAGDAARGAEPDGR